MLQFLLTQIAKLKSAISGISTSLSELKGFKQIFYGNPASVTLNVPNNSRHLFATASSGADTESSLLFISATSQGVINIAEVYKGDRITLTTSTGSVTITYPEAGNRYYFECTLAGDSITKSST